MKRDALTINRPPAPGPASYGALKAAADDGESAEALQTARS